METRRKIPTSQKRVGKYIKISHGDEKKVQGTPSFRSGVYHRGTTYLHVVVHIQTGGNLIDPIDDRYFNLSSQKSTTTSQQML